MVSRVGVRYAVVPLTFWVERKFPNRKANAGLGDPTLGNFDGKGSNVLHEFSAFINGLSTDLISRDERHFGNPADVTRAGCTISLRIQGGSSGIRSHLHDLPTGKHFDRGFDTVEQFGYRLLFVAPPDAIVGFMMVEGIGNKTLTIAARDEFRRCFGSRHPDFRIVFATVTEEKLWQQIEAKWDEHCVHRIEVSRREISSSEAKNTGVGTQRKNLTKFTQIADFSDSPRTGKDVRNLRRRWTGKKTAKGVIEVTDPITVNDLDGQHGEIVLRENVIEIVIDATLNGSRRKVHFTGKHAQPVRYVIKLPAGAELTDDIFYAEARSHVRGLADDIAVKLDDGWNTGDWDHPERVKPMEVQVHDPGSAG